MCRIGNRWFEFSGQEREQIPNTRSFTQHFFFVEITDPIAIVKGEMMGWDDLEEWKEQNVKLTHVGYTPNPE